MKIPKEAARTARQLIRATMRNGSVDSAFAKAVVDKLSGEKPRHYLAILTSYHRLLRMELDQRHAVVESAQPLPAGEQESVLRDLRAKYGADITIEYRVNAELLGGMRIKLGSNVWDGTVKSRLDTLRDKLLA